MTCLHRERQFLVNGDYYREQIKLPGVYGLEIMGTGKKVMVLVCVWRHGGPGCQRRREAGHLWEEVEIPGKPGWVWTRRLESLAAWLAWQPAIQLGLWEGAAGVELSKP